MSMENAITTMGVLIEVGAEREKQDSLWGEQNHPLMSRAGYQTSQSYLREAEHLKRLNDGRAERGTLSWDGVLLEELYEAFAETDPAKVRAEMIQVAAVAVGIIECIDRAAA